MEKRIISMLLIVSMLCGLCACGKTASANEMKLVKTEGAARVTDEKRVEQRIQENMNLYSGYGVRTEEHSFAWMNLDFVKLLKLNESSNAVLEKDGRKLTVVLQSGDMFFCVLEELEKDESLTLETGNMSMAIRGTCGIVRVLSDRESLLVLLEGKVTVSDTAGTVRQDVETGQVLNLYVEDDGTANLTLREIRSDDILDFAREYIDEDTRIQEKIEDGGGTLDFSSELNALFPEPRQFLNLTNEQAMVFYSEVIENARNTLLNMRNSDDLTHHLHWGEFEGMLASAEWSYALYDVNKDGAPELLFGRLYNSEFLIEDCWTTNGTEARRVTERYLAGGLVITANGCIVEYRDPLIYVDWWYSFIDPFYRNQAYHDIAHIEAVIDPLHPDSFVYNFTAGGWYSPRTTLLENATKEELLAFIDENCPRIPEASLDWQPLA